MHLKDIPTSHWNSDHDFWNEVRTDWYSFYLNADCMTYSKQLTRYAEMVAWIKLNTEWESNALWAGSGYKFHIKLRNGIDATAFALRWPHNK